MAGQGTAGQRRRHGPDCRIGAKNWGRMWPRWAVAPLGFRQLRRGRGAGPVALTGHGAAPSPLPRRSVTCEVFVPGT